MSRLYPAQEEPSEKQPDGSMPDPKLAHVREQWKYSSPLIACSFDPRGNMSLPVPKTTVFNVGIWNLLPSLRLLLMTAGFGT